MALYADAARPLDLFVFSMHFVDGPELPTKGSSRRACAERFLHLGAAGGAAEPDRDEAWEHASDLLEAQGWIESAEVCWEQRVHAPVDSWVCFRFLVGARLAEMHVSRVGGAVGGGGGADSRGCEDPG